MKQIKTIQSLAIGIILLAGIVALIGVLSGEVKAYPHVVSVFGETIELYNKGIYARNSVSMASQAIAQDFITLILGIPMSIGGLFLIKKKRDKGLFLLTGTLGYFLYTYASYAFLVIFNALYIVYVIIMVLSFWAFVLCINQLNKERLWERLSPGFPAKSLSRFLWITGVVIGLMWLGRIVPALISASAPVGLEHYSTMGIQTLDLGFVVPTCIIASYLLKQKNKWGYLLSVVLVIKAVTMTAAVSAMAIFMRMHGVSVTAFEMVFFPIIFLVCSYYMVRIFRCMK